MVAVYFYDKEPLLRLRRSLLTMDNVGCTPHLAASSATNPKSIFTIFLTRSLPTPWARRRTVHPDGLKAALISPSPRSYGERFGVRGALPPDENFSMDLYPSPDLPLFVPFDLAPLAGRGKKNANNKPAQEDRLLHPSDRTRQDSCSPRAAASFARPLAACLGRHVHSGLAFTSWITPSPWRHRNRCFTRACLALPKPRSLRP